MKQDKNKSLNNGIGAVNPSGHFEKWVQKMLSSRDAVEGYISSCMRDGMSRSQALAELHQMGIYLSNVK